MRLRTRPPLLTYLLAVPCDSCLFQNIIVARFTELNFFKQAWGHLF